MRRCSGRQKLCALNFLWRFKPVAARIRRLPGVSSTFHSFSSDRQTLFFFFHFFSLRYRVFSSQIYSNDFHLSLFDLPASPDEASGKYPFFICFYLDFLMLPFYSHSLAVKFASSLLFPVALNMGRRGTRTDYGIFFFNLVFFFLDVCPEHDDTRSSLSQIASLCFIFSLKEKKMSLPWCRSLCLHALSSKLESAVNSVFFQQFKQAIRKSSYC